MAFSKPFPTDGTRPIGSLDELAAAFALRPAAEAEALIESFCAEAVHHWRLDDATFWQRVKFRARLLRAVPMAPGDIGGGDSQRTGRA